MASHDFQESLKNYLDLERLRARLVTWQSDLQAYEELIELRRAYYEPRLPDIDRHFRRLDSQMRLRLEQREHIEQRLRAMLVAPRPDFLATAEERVARDALRRLEKKLTTAGTSRAPELQERLARLHGLLDWSMHTEYAQRLGDTYDHLRSLDGAVDDLKQQYESFVRVRQAATQSYQGYAELLRTLRLRIESVLDQVTAVMARQGHLIETMAEYELVKRRDRLDEFQVKARFAMADSYDRAIRERQKGEAGDD